MTDEEFEEKIEEAGYKRFPWPRHNWCEGRAYSKRLGPEATQCLTNEHKTAFHLYRYDKVNLPENSAERPYTVEIEIVGEYREDKWCDLKIYAITDDQFMAEREKIEKELRVAWECITLHRERPDV